MTYLLLSVILGTQTAATPAALPADISRLCGKNWIGKLTYLDYTSGKKTSISATFSCEATKDDPRSWNFIIGYPKEADHNESEKVVLSPDGTMLNKEKVIERTSLRNDRIRIVTEIDGDDNRAKAKIKFIYLISDKAFSIQKLVRPQGKPAFFERNIYEFKAEPK